MAGIPLGQKNNDGNIVISLGDTYLLTELKPLQFQISRKDGGIVEDINRGQLEYLIQCYLINRSFLAGEAIIVEDVNEVKVEKSKDHKNIRITFPEEKKEEEEMETVRIPEENRKVVLTTSPDKPKSLIRRLQEKVFGKPIQR